MKKDKDEVIITEYIENEEDFRVIEIPSFVTGIESQEIMYGSVFAKVRQSLKVINKSKIDNMYKMFAYYEGEKLDLSEFDTSNVKGMGSMFDDCNKLDKINVKNRAVNSSFNRWRILDNK